MRVWEGERTQPMLRIGLLVVFVNTNLSKISITINISTRGSNEYILYKSEFIGTC